MQNKPYERRVTYGPLHTYASDAYEYLRDCYATGELSPADKPEVVMRHVRVPGEALTFGAARWQIEISY